jgi:hypothetical protein
MYDVAKQIPVVVERQFDRFDRSSRFVGRVCISQKHLSFLRTKGEKAECCIVVDHEPAVDFDHDLASSRANERPHWQQSIACRSTHPADFDPSHMLNATAIASTTPATLAQRTQQTSHNERY